MEDSRRDKHYDRAGRAIKKLRKSGNYKGKNLSEQQLHEISIRLAANSSKAAERKGKQGQADRMMNYAYKKRIKSDNERLNKERLDTYGRGGSPYQVYKSTKMNEEQVIKSLYDTYMEMYIKDMGKSMSYKVTPNEREKPSTRRQPMKPDTMRKLDKMSTRGTPNERQVAKKKQSGPSLPNFN